MKKARSIGLLLFCAAVLCAPLWASAAPVLQDDASPGQSLLLPLIVVGVVLLLSVGRRLFASSGTGQPPSEAGRPRVYGIAGGAVCRQCGRPFARGAFDPNLLVGKLVRCPHCGKWAILPAASPVELAAAEERERLMGMGGTPSSPASEAPVSEEEKLRRQIENSKFE